MSPSDSARRVAAAVLVALAADRAFANPWPLEDGFAAADGDRPLLATFEYKEAGNVYLHEGIDIPARAWIVPSGEDPDASWVVAVAPGVVESLKRDPGNIYNFIQVRGDDGLLYEYRHVEHFLEVMTSGNPRDLASGDRVSAGQRLARVVRWPCEEYTHLHLAAEDANGKLVMPLDKIQPFTDVEPPVVSSVEVCPKGVDCDPTASAGCDPGPRTCLPVEAGKLAVVADLYDLHTASDPALPVMRRYGDLIAPRTIVWRHCAESAPDCASWERFLELSSIERQWTRQGGVNPVWRVFDSLGRCASSGDYCTLVQRCTSAMDPCTGTGERFRYVVTNVGVDGVPDANAWWDAQAVPEGHRTVAVAATDFGGNTGRRSVPICLYPESTSCTTTKLTIRDCESDNGAEPSDCAVGWLSPDIIENPDAAGQPGPSLAFGAEGTVRVCATNTGCAVIRDGNPLVKVTFALDWARTTGAVAYPVGTAGGTAVTGTSVQVFALTDRQGKRPQTADWKVGEERCQDLKWTPTEAGHVCLVARVAHGTDAPTPTPGVPLDNNRAQHNFIVSSVNNSSASAFSSVVFQLAPLREVRERTVVFEVDPERSLGRREVRVQLATDASFARAAGGRVAGFVSRDDLARWERREPLEACDRRRTGGEPCLAANRGAASDLAVVEIDPRSRELVLSEVVVERTSTVELFSTWEASGPGLRPVDIHVRERIASPSGVGTVEIGGLTIRLGAPGGVPGPR